MLILGCALCFFFTFSAGAQSGQEYDTTKYIRLRAANKYYKNNFYKFLWGEHYRKEWHTPVLMPIVKIDTLLGGLIPYKLGGGRQTKSIRVTDKKRMHLLYNNPDKRSNKQWITMTFFH